MGRPLHFVVPLDVELLVGHRHGAKAPGLHLQSRPSIECEQFLPLGDAAQTVLAQ